MTATLQTKRGTFSQLSDELWVSFSDGGAVINADIPQSELIEFALNLLDVADDCFLKLKADSEEITDCIRHAMSLIHALESKS